VNPNSLAVVAGQSSSRVSSAATRASEIWGPVFGLVLGEVLDDPLRCQQVVVAGLWGPEVLEGQAGHRIEKRVASRVTH